MPDEQLISLGEQLNSDFDRGIDWLKQRGALGKSMSTNLFHHQRLTQKITKALTNKPVFAAFGASQVGKSYLIKNILSDEDSPLMIEFGGGRLHNFIDDINPIGQGRESTGVVTRFTIDKNSGGDFPVKIKLLEVKDLIIIFSNALIDNIDFNTPNRDALFSQLERLDRNEWESDFQVKIDKYDVREIRDYLESKHPNLQGYWRELEDVGFWNFVEGHFNEIIQSSSFFNDTFGILWMNNELLSDQFRYLIEAHHDLTFNSEIWTEIRSVLRPNLEYGQEEGIGGLGLIEVKCVEALAKDPDLEEKIAVLVKNQNKESISHVNRDALSALSKEITLNVSCEGLDSRSFLETTDLMDFPGARSKRNLEDDNISKNDVPRGIAFLRAKVAYLFEKYSNDFEMNNLLFCIPPEQNNITGLPATLNDWVERNVGGTPEQRNTRLQSMKSPPLMIILTKWNKNLVGDPSDTPQDLGQRWDTVFNTFLRNEYISGKGWDRNWTAAGDKFTNYYLLRDFKYSKELFESNEQNEGETRLSSTFKRNGFENVEDYFSKLKSSFLKFEFVREFIPSPEEVWEESSTPGKDGSALIIEALNKASEFSGFEQHSKEVLTFAKSELENALAPFLRGEDEESQRRNGKAFVQRLRQIALPLITRQSDLIYRIQLALTANHDDFLPLLQKRPLKNDVNNPETVQRFLMAFPQLNPDLTVDEIVKLLTTILGLPAGEIKVHVREHYDISLDTLFHEQHLDTNSIVSDVIDLYAQEKLKMNNEMEKIVQTGFDQDVLLNLLNHYKNGIKNRKVAQKLDPILQHMSARIALGNFDESLISRLIAKWWNEFIMDCDHRFYDSEETRDLEKLENGRLNFKEVYQTNQDEAYHALDDLFGQSPSSDLSNIQTLPGIEKQNAWLTNIERIVLMNCGGVVFDQEEQEELSEILEKIRSLAL
jgi:hypothetical protein